MNCNHQHLIDIPHQPSLLHALPANHVCTTVSGRTSLLQASREAAEHAYAPDSNFYVGSAVKAHSQGDMNVSSLVFKGNNTETGGHEGLTCGERGAVLDAVTHGAALGQRAFIEAIAVTCSVPPSPYNHVLDKPDNAMIADLLDTAVHDQQGAYQYNFAAFTPGWLVDQFVQQALSDISPCGACRQVIREFSDENTIVMFDDGKDGILARVRDLLPAGFCFGPDNDNAGHDTATPADIGKIEQGAKRARGSKQLTELAAKVASNSYAWGGAFKRNGAVIITDDNKVYAGASMINSSTGLSVNSLRAAITRAVQDGAAKGGVPFVKEASIAFVDGPDNNGRGDLNRVFNGDLCAEFMHDDTHLHMRNNAKRTAFRLRDVNAVLTPAV